MKTTSVLTIFSVCMLFNSLALSQENDMPVKDRLNNIKELDRFDWRDDYKHNLSIQNEILLKLNDRIDKLSKRVPEEESEKRAQEMKSLQASFEAIPTGAVVPFIAVKCPDGWDDYKKAAGRTIVGVGQGEDTKHYTLEEMGGAETHTLTIEQMPSHTHEITTAMEYAHPATQTVMSFNPVDQQPRARSLPEGKGKPHNNMPPYLALRYCVKK